MFSCGITREALRESGENTCPSCQLLTLFHDSEAMKIERKILSMNMHVSKYHLLF